MLKTSSSEATKQCPYLICGSCFWSKSVIMGLTMAMLVDRKGIFYSFPSLSFDQILVFYFTTELYINVKT